MLRLEKIIEELAEQIVARQRILTQLVGNLYPPLIQGEIDKLSHAISILEGRD